MEGKARRSRSPEPRKPRLYARLATAWAAIGWERIWRSAWPSVLVAGLFVAVALSDVLPALPGWHHVSVLIAFVLGFVYTAWRGFRGFHLPNTEEARRRWEVVGLCQAQP